ncbi:MAG: hypothetical protein ACOYN0_09740 [Phycisphaerales bacterium]
MRSTSIVFAAVAAAGTSALAQTPLPIQNPSFELANPFNNANPLQFSNNNDAEARWRSNTDGLIPAVTARTGNRCLELGGRLDGGFCGFTTDQRNFFLPGFPFYDVAFDWAGGDVQLTVWYMIPADEPVVGAGATVKMDVKGAGNGNQNNASFDPFEVGSPYANRLIFGHTNGQWVEYRVLWTRAEIDALVAANQAEFGYPLPPNPNRIKLTFGRFRQDNPSTPQDPISGLIFFDDITFEQLPIGPQCSWSGDGCFADFNNDGGIDGDDVITFFGDWDSNGPCADVDGSGGTDGDDVIAFFSLWDSGGTGVGGCQ